VHNAVTVTTVRNTVVHFPRTLAASDSLSSGFSVLLSVSHRQRRPAQHKPGMLGAPPVGLGQTTGVLCQWRLQWIRCLMFLSERQSIFLLRCGT